MKNLDYIVSNFLNEMCEWEIYMKNIDEYLEVSGDDLDEDELESLESRFENEAREKLYGIFVKYLSPSILKTDYTERLISLSYSIPPDFENFSICEINSNDGEGEVIVKINDAFESILKFSVCKDDRNSDDIKINAVYVKRNDKWQKYSF